MANHPWRQYSHMFTCEPDCPKREPGCQAHCEKHIREKAEWDKCAAIENQRKDLNLYTSLKVSYYKDRQARCDKGGLLRKTDHSR